MSELTVFPEGLSSNTSIAYVPVDPETAGFVMSETVQDSAPGASLAVATVVIVTAFVVVVKVSVPAMVAQAAAVMLLVEKPPGNVTRILAPIGVEVTVVKLTVAMLELPEMSVAGWTFVDVKEGAVK
jgi:hypothetical protein